MKNNLLENINDQLTIYKKGKEVERSGLPIGYRNDELLYDNHDFHTLVIGCTGSGKTQTVLLPSANLAITANESLIIKDNNGEIKEMLNERLVNNGYKIYTLNFDNLENSNCYNPIAIAERLYKEGNVDFATTLLENIAHYIFANEQDGGDPFWVNSARQYFIGMCFHLFEQKENITLKDIYDTTNTESEINDKVYFQKLFEGIDKESVQYMYLNGVLNAPTETLGGILSVFKQQLRTIVSRPNLNKALSNDDIDLTKLIDEKFALFMIGEENPCIGRLESMFINQLFYIARNKHNKKRINLLIDDSEALFPLKEITNLLDSCRSLNLKFTIFVKSLLEVRRIYGENITDLLVNTIGAIVFLLANDDFTCEQVSKICGKENEKLLILPEELKLLNQFEAVIKMPRKKPIKTKLMPNYKIEW